MHLESPGRLPLPLDRTRVMGVLNVTPDSFSDGGRFVSPDAALAQAAAMLDAGADIIDVGGESTRPGAVRINAAEQINRVVPVIEAIHAKFPQVWISIDTTQSEVAEAALGAGACMLNDVAGGREDQRLLELAAKHAAPIVLMHMQGEPATMQACPTYRDVVAEVRDFLLARAAAAESVGVDSSRIILDPGIGFGKSTKHNLELLGHLDELVAMGYPVLLGCSRKRFIGEHLEPDERLGGTVATSILAAQHHIAIVRVHDVQPNHQAIELLGRIEDDGEG